MNFALLDSIRAADRAVLVTIIGASGHTYQKTGQKALFAPEHIEPVYGNLGALCADQEIARHAARALAAGRPLVTTIDTTRPMDELMGSGTGCGGTLKLLLEPLGDEQKAIYAALRENLRDGPRVFLVHDLESGHLRLDAQQPADSATLHVETIDALTPLYLFGATPLTRRVIAIAREMDFVVHLSDWRPAFRDLFEDTEDLEIHTESFDPPANACVVIMSHSFERDLVALRAAVGAGCRYVGLLSSRSRRDRMFDRLTGEGVAKDALAGVCCPVGIDIGARTDSEIAVAIMAEIIGRLRS
ncbi:MAG TPA: XdhC family protein [Candidatus Krumholzibacteria bacterium]|nr:XdhC family protein [Candidatus Krumholzibacteria bacterium]